LFSSLIVDRVETLVNITVHVTNECLSVRFTYAGCKLSLTGDGGLVIQ